MQVQDAMHQCRMLGRINIFNAPCNFGLHHVSNVAALRAF